jgi:hypothetical protein
MKIVRRDLDGANGQLREHVLNIHVSSREEGEAYLRDQVSRGFDTHGFDPVNNCWWGRHANSQHISRFFIEA